MYFSQRKRDLVWCNGMADAKQRARDLVPELSPDEAALLCAQLDEFARLPVPRTFLESFDFCRPSERFRWYLDAVEAGAKPSLLRPVAYVARYGPFVRDVS